MNDINPKDDNSNVDFYSPEGSPGQDAANWKVPVHREQVPLGGSSETTISKPPQVQQKESEWPMGVRKFVEVTGKRWEYLEYGNPEGEPILNVHGWLGASAEGNEKLSKALTGKIQNSLGLQNLEANVPKGATKVKALVEGLKGKYHVIAPQLPGFGHSEALNDPTLDNVADELADFQKAIGLESSVFFGSSMGGILGIKLAARHPEAVRALIIQGTMTQPKDMDTATYIAGKVATWKPIANFFESHPNLAKGIFKRLVQGNEDFKLGDEYSRQRIIDDTDSAESHTALNTLRGIGSHIEEEIDKTEAPVVVMDGVAGKLVPIAKSKEIAGRFHTQVDNPEENLQKNIAERRTMYFQVGGVAGEHGHSVVNTAPEEVAVLINHAVNYFNAGVAKA